MGTQIVAHPENGSFGPKRGGNAGRPATTWLNFKTASSERRRTRRPHLVWLFSQGVFLTGKSADRKWAVAAGAGGGKKGAATPRPGVFFWRGTARSERRRCTAPNALTRPRHAVCISPPSDGADATAALPREPPPAPPESLDPPPRGCGPGLPRAAPLACGAGRVLLGGGAGCPVTVVVWPYPCLHSPDAARTAPPLAVMPTPRRRRTPPA